MDNIDQFMSQTSAVERGIAEYYLEVTDQNLQLAVQYYKEDTNFASMVVQDDTKDVVEVAQEPPESFSLLEWNIQGLLPENLQPRVTYIAEWVNANKPDVVFLQEMVQETVEIFNRVCTGYEIHLPKRSNLCHYFVAILTLKSSVQVAKKTTLNFPHSTQGRNAVVLKARKKSQNLTLITSHLESCKPAEEERISQLDQIWKVMSNEEGENLVVFAADTNLRDYEVTKYKNSVGSKFDGIKDAWEDLGFPQHLRYSWDTTKNDNQIQNGKAKLRFERIYFQQKAGCHLKLREMKFVGQDRLRCGMFPSDHWGVEVKFTKNS